MLRHRSAIKRHFPTLLVLVLFLAFFLFRAPAANNFTAHPQPTTNFSEAVGAVNRLQLQMPEALNPVCGPKLFVHDKKVARAIVFFHGFTNCPEQFSKLGKIFFDAGYNVYIPREPHHGLANRLTEDLKNLKAKELVEATDQSIDIAVGLGDQVTVVGLSGGAVMASWAAQNRPEVAKAVIIAPNFSIPGPTFLQRPATNLGRALPAIFLWWDPKTKENIPGANYFYPRYPTRALAAFMELGIAVEQQAKQQAPKAGKIIVVTNDNDTAVNNKVTMRVLQHWQQHTASAAAYQFPADLHVPHDLIDPENEPQTQIVYPTLVNLITRN